MKTFEQKLAEAIARLEADLGNPEAWPAPAAIHLKILSEISVSPAPLELVEIQTLRHLSGSRATHILHTLAGLLGIYEFPIRLIRTGDTRHKTRTYLYSLKRHHPTT